MIFFVGVQIFFSHMRSYGTKLRYRYVCVYLQVLTRAFNDSVNRQMIKQKYTPHATDEGATGAHTHPHG